MKPTTKITLAATLLCAHALAAHAQTPTADPYAGLKSYDFLNRAPVAAVWQMIRAIPQNHNQDAIEIGLIGVLQDPNSTFPGKREACRMLYEIGSDRSVPVLAPLLTDPELSDAARYALERNPSKAAAKAFRDALKTATGKPLIGVINSLGDRHDRDAFDALMALENNSDTLVARAAAKSAEKITGDTQPLLPLSFTGNEQADVLVASKVASSGNDSQQFDAIKRYPTLTPPVQTALIAGFGARGDKDAAPLVESALVSPDPYLRAAAIRASGPIEGAKAVPALAKIAASGDGRDKREARAALAQIPGADADKAILQLSRASTDPAQRAALLDVLADRNSPAYHASLLDAAKGSDEKVAVAAIKSFAQAGTTADEPALVAILTTTQSEQVRDTAGDALASIGQRAADKNSAAQPLVDAMPKSSPPAQAALVGAMAQIGGDRAIAAVGGAVGSPDATLSSAAITGLAETTTDPAALPVLWNLAKTSPDHSTRVQALRGYLRILSADERMPAPEKVGHLKDALALADRPEEKKSALSALRACRTPAALELAAANLDDPAVFDEAADAVLALAAPAKAGNRNLPAVKSPATGAALAKIAANSKDDAVKAKAQGLQTAQ